MAAPARPVRIRRGTPAGIARALRSVWVADPRGTLLAGAMQLGGALAALGVVLASKLALDAVLSGPETDRSGLVLALVLLAVVTALAGALGPLQSQQQRLLAERVAQGVWSRLLAVCLAVDLVRWESNAFIQRLDRVRSNAVSRPTTVVTALLGLTGSAAGVIALVAALIGIHPLLVPLLLVAGIPAVAASRQSSRAEFSYAASITPVLQRRNYLKVLLSHRLVATEVRAFDSGPDLLRRHESTDRQVLEQLTKLVRRRQLQSLVTTGAAGAALTLTLLVIAGLVTTGRISLAEAGAAAIAARLLGGQLAAVFASTGALIESGPFLDDLEDFLQDAPPSAAPGTSRPLEHELRLTSARFGYEGREDDAVGGVDLVIPAGAVVALVGENGSGKTTLAKVVAGLYPTRSGAITWDGEQISGPDLRASTSVIFQDFIEYQMTPLENVTISNTREPADRERVERVLDEVGLTAVMASMPHGIDTVLGMELAEGSDLSGGQWQRLALARALYRDAPLLVLDEPSAALDPRAEHELFADVRGLLQGRSALLISHRYSSVRLADYIYVLADGKVFEEGTHDQLVAAGGQYAELYALQAAAYLR